MKINHTKEQTKTSLLVVGAYSLDKSENKKTIKNKNETIKFLTHSQYYKNSSPFIWSESFSGNKGEITVVPTEEGNSVLLVGLGNEGNLITETIRRHVSQAIKQIFQKKITVFSIDLDSFSNQKNNDHVLKVILEALFLSTYQFEKYKTQKKSFHFENVSIISKQISPKIFNDIMNETLHVTSSINLIRDYVNECPGILHSEYYAKIIQQDAQKLKNVKIKVLNKKEIQAEKMNLFLSVNAGSAYEPRFVHLTYTPKKATKNTKHYVLVGKGITYDTGGYSLKPATSMTGMKGDMAGSATVYGAFRAAVLNHCENKISCLLVLTDNKINSHATVPDTIVTGRNGKTVEILNTDAEGRLILADAMDYACDLKPDAIIDAATLTGACLVALGKEVCAILGNNQLLIDKIKNNAQLTDEYIWQLPIIPEYRDDIKSKVADIKNIGSPMRAGTAIGAAFIEQFIKNDIPWAHLDIAGVSDDQSHLGYCPPHGSSGLMVRTIYNFLMNE